MKITARSLRRRGRLTRRFVGGALLGTMGFCTAGAVSAIEGGPEWLEVTELDLAVRNLPGALAGCRLVHISDLHCSRTVSERYLRRCLKRINGLEADIIVLTGDYVTHDMRGRYKNKVIEILGGLDSRLGVYACLGNHDYGMVFRWQAIRDDQPAELVAGMRACGIKTLRNEAFAIEAGGQRLWMVGLGDWWADDFDPERAFSGVPAGESAIVLMHNPAGVERLEPFRAAAIMCGHTHGRRTRAPIFDMPVWLTKGRRYAAGLFDVHGTQLYVNRGLGRHGRLQFNSRPEITVFTLQVA